MKKIIIVVSFQLALAVSANASESLPAAQSTTPVTLPAPQGASALSSETKTSPGDGVPAKDEEAFETPLRYPTARRALSEIGKSYGRYAAGLGCGHFAWGTISSDGSEFMLKYLPPEATMTNWTKMVLLTVYSLPGDKGPKDAQAIASMIAVTEGEYIKLARVTNDQNYPVRNGEITMFLQYTFGQIDAAAAFIRTGPSSASLIQLQQRGGRLSQDDILKVHKLASPQAALTTPKK